MTFNEYLQEQLKDEEFNKEYERLSMKEVKVICPTCGNQMIYKNYWSWILHTPFHWFCKRRAKCTNCGEVSYMRRERRSNEQCHTESTKLTKNEFQDKYCRLCGSQRCEGIGTEWFDGCKYKDQLEVR